MSKLYRMIVLPIAAALLLCGCEDINDVPESSSSEALVETEAVSVPETDKKTGDIAFPDADETNSISGEYVFDDAEVLSEKEKSEIYNDALYISRTFKINCAVVTSANMDGKSASEYAGEYYKKLYGGSNGIMFLINNDTGDDYILRKGAPANFIANEDIEMLFAEISPMLVTEKYAEAVKCVFGSFAERLPQYAVDRTNNLEKEEITAVNDILAAASTEGKSVSMIFVGNLGNKTIADYTKAQYANYSSLNSDSTAVIVVNIQTGEYYICGGGSFADAEKNQGALKSAISDCLTAEDTVKTFNCRKATELFSDYLARLN